MSSLKVVAFITLLAAGHCGLCSGFVVADPWNLAQNTQTALATAKSTLELIEQSKRQIQQLENSVKNLKNISDKDWTQIHSLLQNLSNQMQQSQHLANSLSELSRLYQDIHPDIEIKKDYPGEYRKWSNTVTQTFDDSLKIMNSQASSIHDERAFLSELSRISETAEGRMQAIQAANLMAAEYVSQLQKLRELMMAQSTIQLVDLSHKHQQKHHENMTIEKMIKNTKSEPKKYGTGKGFGLDDFPVLLAPRR